MSSSNELFLTLVHICVPVTLVAGGVRLLWLFLSRVPKAIEAVERPRLLSIGRFAPLLIVLGCGGAVAFVAIVLWLESAPHGWWNIVAFLAAYALGIVGTGAILVGIVVQSTLVDAYRGFDLDADTGNLQRNLDAAIVFALGIILLAAMNYRWLPELDWSTATLADIRQRELVIRAPIYLAAFAVLIRTYHVVRGEALEAKKALNRLRIWGGLLLFIAFNSAMNGILPRDYEIERYVRDRGKGLTLFGIESPAAPPPDLWHGELLALVALSLVVTMCVTIFVDMIARRGVSSAYVPRRLWPGGLFICLALLSTATFARQGLPHGVALDWMREVAAPSTIGLMLVRVFPVLSELGVRGRRFATKTAARGLFGQILVFLALGTLAIALLYAASLLTTTGFIALLLGGIAAATLGLLRFPAPAPTAAAVPAATR